ncbi:MAG: hypothetical protein ACE5EU_13700 [Paracoccaceae bacterium]
MPGARFTKALCAILLLLAAPATATAQAEGDDKGGEGAELPGWARVRLQFANGDRFIPEALVINVSGTAGADLSRGYYLDLREPAEQRDENKLDLGSSLLGALGVGQETTSSEFRGAARVGDVYQIGDLIVVDPLPGADGVALARSIRTTVIANQGVSFVIGGIFASVEQQGSKVPMLGDIPALGRMFRSRIGDAHRKNDSLLILVTPHLIDIGE